MSYSPDQKFLVCDAPDCNECVAVPVILGIMPAQRNEALPLASRWLHVKQGDIWHHFCPAHSANFLARPGEPISDLLLVADKSTASYSAVEQAATFLDGVDGIKVTLLFLACGRCATSRRTTPAKVMLEQAPQENYCLGTRNAIDKLSALFENRSIPFLLTVQFVIGESAT